MASRPRLALDGPWRFSTTEPPVTDDLALPDHPWSLINVPGPWQADPRFREHMGPAWYQRDFELPAEWLGPGCVTVLGFGAVDYFAEVWVNGEPVGRHEGGYLPFELDITAPAHRGTNTVTVRVDDPLEIFDEIPHGKQSWYGQLSGLWQPVWVESRAETHIQRVRISTAGDQVAVEVSGRGNLTEDLSYKLVGPDGRLLAWASVHTPRFSLRVEDPRAWSPDEPQLYTLTVFAGADQLSETFGFRTIETRAGRILLNGRPFYLRGALDQDYYPDLICTPPSQEYIEAQFRQAKAMGFNCLRIHIKVGDPRYYAAADRIGLLLWTELPNHSILTDEARRRARETLAGMLERDGNHPSIGIWTLINESWGIDLTDPSQRAWLTDTYRWFKALDPTRLVVGNSACWSNFHVITDIADFHMYYAMPDHLAKWRSWTQQYMDRPWWLFAHDYTAYAQWRAFVLDPWSAAKQPPAVDVEPRGDEPLLVSEFGNWGLPDVGKLYEGNGGTAPWWFETGLEWSEGVVYPRGIEDRFRAYHLDRVFPSLAALTEASQRLQLAALKFQIETMRAYTSIQGYVVTELTDVHWESNGLLDMYRNPKVVTPQLQGFNADDMLIPHWERLAYAPGESCAMAVSFSHYSAFDVPAAELQWELRQAGVLLDCGQWPVGACPPFENTSLGALSFEIPAVNQPAVVQLVLRLYGRERLLAVAEQQLYLFPEPAPLGGGRPVYAPEFGPLLSRLGYTVVDDLSQASVAVVSVLDDTYRNYLLRGGRALLLAEDDEALQMHVPGLKIKERDESVWQGDWASSFGWHRFDDLPTGGVVDFAFAGLTPEYILAGFRPLDFAFDVYAGLFVGWLHRPVATMGRRRVGQGEVLVSTFQLAGNLDTNPLARSLLVRLLQQIERA